MKWLKRKLRNWLLKNEDPDAPEEASNMIGTARPRAVRASDAFEADNGLNMRVYKAHGGKIVSFNHYDRKTDREQRSVYIITDEQDFERELGKMITMESMRG
jgi:hypothetical protein